MRLYDWAESDTGGLVPDISYFDRYFKHQTCDVIVSRRFTYHNQLTVQSK